MPALLPRERNAAPPSAVPLPPAAVDPQHVERDLRRIADAFRMAALGARILGIALLWSIHGRFEFGQHVIAGLLVGDFAIWLLTTACDWHRLDRFMRAEAVMFAVLLTWAWHSWSMPKAPEHLACFGLAAFAAVVGRVGAWSARRLGADDDGWS